MFLHPLNSCSELSGLEWFVEFREFVAAACRQRRNKRTSGGGSGMDTTNVYAADSHR